MKLRPIIVGFVIITTIIAGAAGLGYWKYQQILRGMAEGANRPEQVETVQIVLAESTPFQRTTSAVGSIQALRHVTIASEVSGKVVEMRFQSGDVVEEGQVLVRLDSSTEEADRRVAEAQRDLAKLLMDRMERAASGKAVSDQDLDKSRAENQQSQARVEQFDALIAKKTIKAPFRGRMGLRDIQPGQYLAEGQRITMLQGIADEVYVDFSVPQIQSAALPLGAMVSVQVAGLELPAKITAIEAQIDQSTRNARLRATMPSLEGRLISGMFVEVRIPLEEPRQVIVASPTAIRRAPYGDHVFIIEPDPKDSKILRAHQRLVTVAGSAGGRVIIASGLKAGDRLAGDGSFKLREGVAVMEAPARTAAAPSDSPK